MIELTTVPEGEKPEMERVELFSIDGKKYTIPSKPRANIALKYLWHAKQHGTDIAAAELLGELLGEAGFKALMEYDDLTTENLNAIMDAAQAIVLGSLEGESGNG